MNLSPEQPAKATDQTTDPSVVDKVVATARAPRTTGVWLLVITAVFALAVWIWWDRFGDGFHEHLGFVVLAAGLGGAVGASELVSRYRDEPTQALLSNAGLLYMGLNAGVAAAAYGLLTNYSDTLIPGVAGDKWITAIAAGFGAMAILRSKFFTIRTEKGEDVAIGPDAAVSAFLAAADRGVDRARATRRLDMVFKRASEIETPAEGRAFLEISLAAFQNLDTDEKKKLLGDIEKFDEQEYPDALKLQAICYLLLSVTGERNFNSMMANLKRWKPPSGAGAGGT